MIQFTSAQTENLSGILTLQQENRIQNRSLETLDPQLYLKMWTPGPMSGRRDPKTMDRV